MKTVIFYSALFLSLNLPGQISHRSDTVFIKEVEIKGETISNDFKGFKTTRIDSSIIAGFNQRTLADLIAENPGIYLKTYGSGGLATPSFRGTGAGHTQITWNNINLNNPMVGQSDLSLIPAGFIDDINIHYGGGSMQISSGGLGGIIDLETKPEWNDRFIVSLSPAIGSYGRQSGLLKIRTGGSGLQLVTKAFFGTAVNNFGYLNSVSGTVPIWEIRKNSEVSQKGFVQELYIRKLRSNFSARVWYQSSSRNLPVPITSQTMNPPEKQSDESLRTMFTYGYFHGITDFKITAAFISDKLYYTNSLASVNSINSSRRLILKGDLERKINDILKVRFAISDEATFVNTTNYSANRVRNIASAESTAEAEIADWLVMTILFRELLQDNKFLSPDFSASAEIKPFPDKLYFIKTSFSRNSKVPTLNDMYWYPGGNPDLKNEYGNISEITWDIINVLTGSLSVKNDFTFFRNHLTNMIQWHPGEFSYWEADNAGSIVTTGIESGLDIIYSGSVLNARLDAGYSYTRASNEDFSESDGKQLVYVPLNQLNALLRVDWRRIYSSISTNFTGKRFLTGDNSRYLPRYSVSNLKFGLNLQSRRTSYEIGIYIDNLFNTAYQNIAYYPMPGRSFLTSVTFQFKK